MDKTDIINYVMHTVHNTNPAILGQMIDELGNGGESNVHEVVFTLHDGNITCNLSYAEFLTLKTTMDESTESIAYKLIEDDDITIGAWCGWGQNDEFYFNFVDYALIVYDTDNTLSIIYLPLEIDTTASTEELISKYNEISFMLHESGVGGVFVLIDNGPCVCITLDNDDVLYFVGKGALNMPMRYDLTDSGLLTKYLLTPIPFLAE